MTRRITISNFCAFSLWATICFNSVAFAQETNPIITTAIAASATAQHARFLAEQEVVSIRLEVFTQGDTRLYDSDFHAGNLLDWSWQNQQGQRLVDGTYRCVVTVKDLAGHISQSYGIFLMQNGEASWQAPAQAETVLNNNAVAVSVPYFALASKQPEVAAAMLAHDGKEARLMTGSGGLSVRSGNFLQGNEQELMRLSTDGKLEINGLIRTSQGLVFPDGTIQKTAYVASGQSLQQLSGQTGMTEDGKPVKLSPSAPAVGGSGTPNKVLKWAANGVDAEDSQITNLPGVGIRVAGSLVSDFNDVAGTGDVPGGYAAFFAGGANRALLLRSANLSGNLWIGHNGRVGVGVSEPASTFASNFNAAIGSGYYNTAAPINGLLIEGNVGIGRTAPVAKLDVAGAINTTLAFMIGGVGILNRNGSNNIFVGAQAGDWNFGSGNTFVGNQAGYGQPCGLCTSTGSGNTFTGSKAGFNSDTGINNTFSGYQAGYTNKASSENTFNGALAGYSNTSGVANTFNGEEAGYSNTTGSYNTFNGFYAGKYNTTGGVNTFNGVYAGYSNSTGGNNTFSGYGAGYYNTTGSFNTLIGQEAGISNTTGSNNTALGYLADFSVFAILNNATAIGARARVECSNCMVLGSVAGINSATNTVKVGIGLTNPTERLHVAGNILATGTITPSDARYKKHIQPLQGALAKVLKLQGVSYDWKRAVYPDMQFSPKTQLGFIAQQVEKILPEAIQQSGNGMYAMNYQALVPLLVEALKQQHQQVEAIRIEKDQQLARLQNQNRILQSQNAALESWINAVENTFARPTRKSRRR